MQALNSYLAHLAKASSHRLLAALLDEHAWLSEYFDIDGYKASRSWRPSKIFRRVEHQWRWYRKRWPGPAIFFQVGLYFELYGSDAAWAAEYMGLRLLKPRFRNVQRAGIPARLVDDYMKRALAVGRAGLKVSETGYPLYHLKERLAECLCSGCT